MCKLYMQPTVGIGSLDPTHSTSLPRPRAEGRSHRALGPPGCNKQQPGDQTLVLSGGPRGPGAHIGPCDQYQGPIEHTVTSTRGPEDQGPTEHTLTSTRGPEDQGPGVPGARSVRGPEDQGPGVPGPS
ncbi:unnamed protein product [Boreogadus saida]